MASSTTLKELSRLLGLAPSTVSRALKGHPDISKVTQERVKALAGQMNYRPSALALSLRSRRSYLIAAIVPRLTDYFYAEVLSTVINLGFDEGYKVVVFENREEYGREVAICHDLEKSGIDGLLIVPAKTVGQNIQHLKTLLEAEIPLVFMDRVVGELDTDRVLEDDFRGAYLAVSHMIKGGCRKIAHLSIPQYWVWGQKRQMGYIQALLDHHLPVDRELIAEYQYIDDVEPIARKLLGNFQVDGIFAATDEGAVKVLNVLNELQYAVPDQVAVCGFGNSPVSGVSCLPLTTVNRDGESMGKIAFEMLLGRIRRDRTGATETKLLRNDLVVRQTTLSLDQGSETHFSHQNRN